MRHFAQLCQALDASTAPDEKVAAMVRYFGAAAPADAAWAVYFLAGGRPRRAVPMALLREVACRRAGIDAWLFETCHEAVGDLAETIAHVLPPGSRQTDAGLAEWIETRLLPLRGLPPLEQAERLAAAWDEGDAAARWLSVKLIGGGLRVGVSRLLVQRALAEFAGLDAQRVAQRLAGWTDARATPDAARWQALVSQEGAAAWPAGQPYPFFLADALQAAPQALGARDDWLVEWMYDGLRAQLVKRAGQVWIWSRGEELVTERFPDVVVAAATLPDGTVLDGELLVWPQGAAAPAPRDLLQWRIGRATPDRKVLAEAPVCFVAFDLLEAGGSDQRGRPQHERRLRLEAMLAGRSLRLSPLVEAADWPACDALRAESRRRGVEGLMLKHRDARYGSGRTQAGGRWWTWQAEPGSVHAVLVYAQAGQGRLASAYTGYTFAVWSRPPASADEARAVVEAIARREPARPEALQLLPFAKVDAGLDDATDTAVDRVVRATTLGKFGPVRSVRPTLVCEIGFEGIHASRRHKSGVTVRAPRLLRLRPDQPLHEADTLDTLHALMCGARQGT